MEAEDHPGLQQISYIERYSLGRKEEIGGFDSQT